MERHVDFLRRELQRHRVHVGRALANAVEIAPERLGHIVDHIVRQVLTSRHTENGAVGPDVAFVDLVLAIDTLFDNALAMT